MSAIKFGLRVPVCAPVTRRDRLVEVVQEAEDLGYDAVFVQDHIHKSFEKHRYSPPGCGSVAEPTNTAEPVMFETIATLAYLAGITDTVELGVGVTPILLREPIVLAKQLATLDVLCHGRFIFGIGVSNVTDRTEFEAMGVPFASYAERYEIAGEFVAAMREIWENSTATFHGKHVNFESLTVHPKPRRRIPIWIGCASLAGGMDRPAVKFAVRHADGLIPPYVTGSEDLRAMIRQFTVTANEHGRDLAEFEWCAQRRISIGSTAEQAIDNIRWMIEEQGEMWRYAGYMHEHGPAGTEVNMAMATVGTAADVRAGIREFVDAGANHIEVAFMYPTHDRLLRQMHLFADEVMPAFR